MALRALLLLGCAAHLAQAARRVISASELDIGGEVGTDAGAYCCCKREACEKDDKGDDGRTPAVYSPNANLCCKLQKWSCDSIFSFFSHRITPPSAAYCERVQDSGFSPPVVEEAPVNGGSPAVQEGDLQPGTPEHTVHSYCQFGRGEKSEQQDAERDGDASSAKRGIVKALVNELAQNSLDGMAKEVFSIYVCVRWAPSREFMDVARGEIRTKQLEDKSTFTHYKDNTFIPLRCSQNLNVYADRSSNKTHYEAFEAQMEALAKWYRSEKEGAVAARLRQLQGSRTGADEVEALAAAFDLQTVQKAASNCPRETPPMTLSTFTATAEELLQDCAAAKWWLGKLRDWEKAMPFPSFMSPDKEAAESSRPTDSEQAVVCFGKRVASQLHRRENGGYLLTDQSMVGCHGFWELEDTAKMIERISSLWRPPTCQLAAMELDLKIKIMEVIASMNSKLFDALPAMLIEEMGGMEDADGKLLEASHGLMALRGVWNSIVSAFKSLRGNYVRLGQLLGDSVVKWVVCPLKPITDPKKLEQLDSALGTEDDLARHYAQTAYAQWTGEAVPLPGEVCAPYQGKEGAPALPRAGAVQRCQLGIMQEDMPEPYKGQDFLCPVRPLLPAKQQLQIFQEKKEFCALRLNAEQMIKARWFYRGHTPHRQQYNVMENLPIPEAQAVKILDYSTRPDSEFGIWRTFVTIAFRCTEEEASLTPRWCEAPAVANVPTLATNLLTGVALTGNALGSAAQLGLEATGAIEKAPSNKATTERLSSWLAGKAKAFEMWIRTSTDQLIGRASGRYERLYAKLFAEVEAAELVHSLSFQVQVPNAGSDSKQRERFDRFAAVAPCAKFDPNREFKLKYAWSEKALAMATKASEIAPGLLTKSGAFRIEIIGAGAFYMRDQENAWMEYSAHVRAATLGGAMPAWAKTNNPYMLDLSGTFNTGVDANVQASDLRGFSATFACGSRVQMHNLALNIESLPGDFAKCVKEGATKNTQLRLASPGAAFFADETVIRVTFAPLAACYHEVDSSLVRNVNETRNPVFKNFISVKGCEPLPSTIPAELAAAKRTSNYRGMLLGKGLPQETLLEVLVEPANFLQEVTL